MSTALNGQWIEHRQEGGRDVLYLVGAWRLASLPGIAQALEALKDDTVRPVVLDGSRLSELDTAAAFLLFRHLSGWGCSTEQVDGRGFEQRHERLLTLVRERMKTPPVHVHSRHLGLVQRIGWGTLYLWDLLKLQNRFLGFVILESLRLFKEPRRFRAKEAVSQFEAVGVDAIPVVALVTFLIGVVFAYLLGIQAKRYGANVFVVDGVGIAMCRELSPLLTSVIVAGRSGAAFTAQIGTMKVQQEIDAITMLGLSPVHVLVVPRVVAIMVALPLLVFVGDVAGILGGMLIGAAQLDIPSAGFLERLQHSLPMSALVIGLSKVPVFGAVIAITACRMGMLAPPDARSVGMSTTSTVVQSIVWVILLDAVFAVALQHVGI